MRVKELSLKIVILDSQEISQKVLAAILATQLEVDEVLTTSSIAEANTALHDGFNGVFVDIFALTSPTYAKGEPRVGVSFIDNAREAFPVICFCLYSHSDLLADMPNVDSYWKRRFGHYFKLKKNQTPERLESDIKYLLRAMLRDIEHASAMNVVNKLSKLGDPTTLSDEDKTEFRHLVETAKSFSQQLNRKKFRENLIIYFSTSELEDLCFDLHVDYENIPGEEISGKVRNIILYFERKNRLNELLAYCHKFRPDISW